MAVGDAHVCVSWLSPTVLTPLFLRKPPTTFLTCFCRGERRKYAGKKSCLNRGLNSPPPGHESDTLTTEPPGRGPIVMNSSALGEEKILLAIIFLTSSRTLSSLQFRLRIQRKFIILSIQRFTCKHRGKGKRIITSILFRHNVFKHGLLQDKTTVCNRKWV